MIVGAPGAAWWTRKPAAAASANPAPHPINRLSIRRKGSVAPLSSADMRETITDDG
jgi:hypothetical protein